MSTHRPSGPLTVHGLPAGWPAPERGTDGARADGRGTAPGTGAGRTP